MGTHRIRTDNSTPIPLYVSYKTEAGEGSIGVGDLTEDYRYIDDYVTPGYKQLIGAGAVINNDCYIRQVRSRTPTGSRTVHWQDQPHKFNNMQGHVLRYLASADGFSFSFPSGPDLSYVIPSLKTEVLAKLDPPEEQLAEDVAEIGGLIAVLRNPLKELVPYLGKWLSSLRYQIERRKAWRARWVKRRFPDNRRTRRQVSERQLRRWAKRDLRYAHAQAWLAVRNVIIPTANSAFAAGRAIAMWNHYHHPARRSETASRTARDMKEVGMDNGYRVYQGTGTIRVTARANIFYQVTPMLLPGSAQKLGLRLKDLPATAWNVIPYSYLINRFIDIEAVIKAVVNMSDPSIQLLACSTSVRTVKEGVWGMTERSPYPYIVSLQAGSETVKDYTYDRRVWYYSYDDLWNPVISGVDSLSLPQLLDLVSQLLVKLKQIQSS